MNVANVSRTLSDLEKAGLVVYQNPKKWMDRIYSPTEKGEKVLEKVLVMK
jgi:DNA-binding PadR family transcriptional regulator